MSRIRIVLSAAVLLIGGVILGQALSERTVHAQEKGTPSTTDPLAGKTVKIFFRDQEPRAAGFDCVFRLDAKVVSADDRGLLVHTLHRWVRGTDYSGEDNTPQSTEDEAGKKYTSFVFVSWSAVKYMEIGK